MSFVLPPVVSPDCGRYSGTKLPPVVRVEELSFRFPSAIPELLPVAGVEELISFLPGTEHHPVVRVKEPSLSVPLPRPDFFCCLLKFEVGRKRTTNVTWQVL